jgi:hypothetical protein
LWSTFFCVLHFFLLFYSFFDDTFRQTCCWHKYESNIIGYLVKKIQLLLQSVIYNIILYLVYSM